MLVYVMHVWLKQTASCIWALLLCVGAWGLCEGSMVALESVAGSAPDMEDSEGDPWPPPNKTTTTRGPRVEYPAAMKLEMALTMMEKANSGICKKEWAKWAEAQWGLPAHRLKKIMLAADSWRQRTTRITNCITKGRGKGLGVLSQANVGCRQGGGGRTDWFKPIRFRVKRWLAVQRSNCHPIESMELVEVFCDQLTAEIEAAQAELKKRSLADVTHETRPLEEKQAHEEKPSGETWQDVEEVPEMATEVVATDYVALEEVTRVQRMTQPELKLWLDKMMERRSKLSEQTYNKYFVKAFMSSIKDTGSLPKPSRLINLSDEDAAMRVKLGWKLWDHQLWYAAFGTASQLQNMVQPPARFIENRKNMVIGQSDQTKICLRTGPREEQKTTKKRKEKQPDGGNEGQVSAAPFLPVKETEGKATPEMFRLTYELRQVIQNYFDESQEPKGSMWKGALIVKGAHGRLDNISPQGFKNNKQICNTCLNNT